MAVREMMGILLRLTYVFLLIFISNAAYASTLGGTSGIWLHANPQNEQLNSSNLFGAVATVELGFKPDAAGLKLSAGFASGRENLLLRDNVNQEGLISNSVSGFLFSALIKYNFSISGKAFGKYRLQATRLLYIFNPWLGIGPTFRANGAIEVTNSEGKILDTIENPGTDFIIDFAFGFNINYGMLMNQWFGGSKVQNLFFVVDIRYSYNLSLLYNDRLRSESKLFQQFAQYWVFQLGAAYRFIL